jgi:ribose transport system substrate-binding protein
VIPRTTGTQLWESEHFGTLLAASDLNFHIYWNGPSREDDVQRQIELVQLALEKKPVGLVLAPDHSLALVSPVQDLIDHGVPVVIVESPIFLKESPNLYFVLNDEETAGRLAAERVGSLLNGEGVIAVLGVDPNIAGIMDRLGSFERHITDEWPRIDIVEERLGYFKPAQAQQVAEDVLIAQHHLNAVFALTSVATRGAVLAFRQSHRKDIKLIGCEQDLATPMETEEIDSIIVENTREMGDRAIRLIDDHIRGVATPHLIRVEPVLVTRKNLANPEIQGILRMAEDHR